MWMSVNFNEISRTICLLSDSNKELYSYLLLGLDIPYFDFNAHKATASKMLQKSEEMDKKYQEKYLNDYGLEPASFVYYFILHSLSLHIITFIIIIPYALLKIISFKC